MNRLILATSSVLGGYYLGRKSVSWMTANELTPSECFIRAKDNLLTATVQQSIYRLGDPNVGLSKEIYSFCKIRSLL